MKTEDLKKLLDTITNGNPKNLFLNHNGLNQLGKLLFYPATPTQEKRAIELKALIEEYYPTISKKLLESLRTYHFSSFYTDKSIIEEQINFLKNNNFNPETILEPSAGNGAYVVALAKAFPNSKIIALEPDYLSFQSLSSSTKKYPNVICNNIPFESFYLLNKNKFDLVISNIPFGQLQIQNAFLHKELTTKEKSVNIFMNRYLPELVNDKGLSMIITSKQFLDSESYNDLRLEVIKKNNLIEAIRFDNELFSNENTSVVTDIIIYQRNNEKQNITEKEKAFSESTNVELAINDNEKKLFSINKYFSDYPNQVNGKLATSHFHSRIDLTVNNNGIVNQYHLKKLLTKVKLEKQQVNQELPPIEQSIIESLTAKPITSLKPKTPEKLAYQEGNRNTVKPTHQGVITIADIQGKNTSFYNNTLHYRNNNIYFHKDEFNYIGLPQQEQLRNYDLYTNYIELKNSYYFFTENIKQNRYNPEQLKQEFEKLEGWYTMFSFRYESLTKNCVALKTDYLYTTLRNKIEKVQDNKVILNPNFTVDYYLSFIAKKEENNIVIENNTQKKETTFDDLIINKFETVNYSKDEELKNTIYKQYNSTGTIDLLFIANLYNTTPENIAKEAFKENIACYNPKFDYQDNFIEYSFELYPLFVSGNLDQKIAILSKEPLPHNLENDQYIKILAANKNEKLDLSEIEFNFESQYISPQIKTAFFEDLINERIQVLSNKSDSSITLLYPKELNHDASTRYSIIPNQEMGIKGSLSYKDMFRAFATNTFPQVTYTIKTDKGDSERKIDVQGTMHAINIYEQLQLEFKAFITSNEIYKEEIETKYYNLFLADKNLKLGPDAITTPKTFTRTPYDHQLEGVSFALNNGTALIDHTVGQGKTLTMSLLAYKLIEHKKAKRILITTEKSVASDFLKAIEESFPTLNVVRLDTKGNFSSKNRNKTLQSLVNSNVDIIIAENSHIPYIAKSNEAIQSIYDKNIEMINQDLENAKKIGAITKETKKIIEGLEQRINTLKNTLNENIKKNEQNISGVTLESLNIEALIIDEAHNFKNIQYTTRHRDVAGLNASSVTTKNFDLETTIHSIHMRKGLDKNIFFFSGTPIINSVTEMYAYQRFLTPNYLEKKNIFNFDAWASNFLKQSIQAESDIFGQVKLHKRFRFFTNIPELSKMYHSFTHISDENTFNTHNFKLIDEFVKLETCDEYEELKEKSIKFAKNKDQIALFGYEKYSKESMAASFVTALTLNRKALIDPLSLGITTCNFDESHQYKLQRLVKDAHSFYQKTNEHKGVVLIFTDLNTWTKDNPENTCNTIRKMLSEQYGIDPSEIGIAQEYIQKNKNDEFQKKIRNGEIRFAIGSTSTMGTGTNIQKRIVAILALDIPYTPHAILQRLGRMLRAGNEILKHYNNTGYYISYGIKNTTDIFSYSLNKHKEGFLKQIKTEVHKQRTFDDVYTDITSVSAAQKEQMLIGDIDSFKLIKLKEDLKQIETQKHFFEIKKNNAVKKISTFDTQIKDNISKILCYKKVQEIILPNLPNDQILLNGTLQEKKQEITNFYQALNNLCYPKENSHETFKNFNYEDYAKYIQTSISLMYHGQTNKELITYKLENNIKLAYCFNIVPINKTTEAAFFSIELTVDTKKVILKGPTRSKFNMENSPNHINSILKVIPTKIKDLTWEIDMTKKSIDSNTKILNTSFPSEKIMKIDSIKKEVKQLEKNINKRKL